jgi:uncharacterized protein
MEATMNRFTQTLFLTFLFLSSWVSAQNYPDRPTEFVSDFADILDEETEQRITATLTELKQSRDAEMKLVTINSIADYGFDGEIEPFATDLFNYWGIGDATRNDGILMLIAIKDRAMRIELGTGYPQHLDQTAKTIIDEIMIPQFKSGNYANGIEKGVYEASHLIHLDASKSESVNYFYDSKSKDQHPFVIILVWALGILASIFGIFRFNKWRRLRPRECPKCKGIMELLPEDREDAHLSAGQQTEERLDSIEYDVWYCYADETVQVCDYQQWFSGYCKCKFCGNKTLGSNSVTIKRATEYDTGTSLVTFTCEHCKENWTELHTIPMVTKSSSSGSSGSSGGSSSGGGASGRW